MGDLMTAPRLQPGPQLRTWKRSKRRHKRVVAIERALAEQLDQALAREAWRESRRPKEAA
jgi:hypothetical protein